ncbi:surface protein [Butyrivibrio sp. ob235]|uniref:BspA family leucine-rich repeat surface protein n=1 Tax=Butyrivibrio sp. ob235 TaxID=1761780 RepID=UPI0008B21F1A|nr:BspA family leucine-rich repeat surface protein [Butyrivibrio sp. ob235]SEK70427.1 surface protein [Butyrivibrio sp. ob235]
MDSTRKLIRNFIFCFCFLCLFCVNKQIAKAQDTTWQNEYSVTDQDYDDTNHYLYIRRYTGNDSVVSVPSKAIKENVEYTTVIYFNVFENNENITKVTFASGCKAASMNNLFQGCTNLTSVTFNDLDTSLVGRNVTETVGSGNFRGTFFGCENLKTLDLSFIDATHATSMQAMLNGCTSLESVNLSGINTSNIKEMGSMFWGCDSLKSVDLSSFDTSNCEEMKYMFNRCSSLEKITFGQNFRAQKVKDFTAMFSGCTSLASVNLSTFDTSNATSFCNMFYSCHSLTSFDFSPLNTAKVNNMSGMFYDCTSLATVTIGNVDTANVTNVENMFRKCNSLKTLDLSNFNAANITNASYIFYETPNLTTIDSPKNLYTQIVFYANYKYYLDDNKDGAPDSDTTYTEMMASGTSHRYIGMTEDQAKESLPTSVSQSITLVHKKIKIAKGDQILISYKTDAKNVSWETSNKKIATVTQSGLLKGKAKGKCTITVTTDGGAKATCEVTVQSNPIKLKSVKASKKKLTLKRGKKYNCYTDFAIRPYNSSIKDISYRSSNKSIAKIAKHSSVIIPKKKGECEIIITVKDKLGTMRTCKLKVIVK